MANTYTLINSVIASSGSLANIEFTSIPATYTDLILKISARSDASSGGDRWRDISIGFNGAGSNASITNLIVYGLGNSAGSTSSTTPSGGAMPTSDATASTFSNCDIYITNYASSTHKLVSMDNVTEHNDTRAVQSLTSVLWSNTAAITSITLYPNSNNFAQHTTVRLYGIKNT
jgi:hypothetical protein